MIIIILYDNSPNNSLDNSLNNNNNNYIEDSIAGSFSHDVFPLLITILTYSQFLPLNFPVPSPPIVASPPSPHPRSSFPNAELISSILIQQIFPDTPSLLAQSLTCSPSPSRPSSPADSTALSSMEFKAELPPLRYYYHHGYHQSLNSLFFKFSSTLQTLSLYSLKTRIPTKSETDITRQPPDAFIPVFFLHSPHLF